MTRPLMVEATSVWKRFGREEVLRDVNLQVRAGEVACLVGPSGAGKSTFLRCINHLERIDSGRILVDGEMIGYREAGDKIYELKEREVCKRRSALGMVFQNFNLYQHMTALENVVLAPKLVLGEPRREATERAHELLRRVGLLDKAQCYPRELSGGQQQRVAIARALAVHPKIVLLDEPTSALDPELVGEVLDTVRSLADDGLTMVVVTHEIAMAREIADVVAFMEFGRVVEFGPPSDVLVEPRSERVRAFLARVL